MSIPTRTTILWNNASVSYSGASIDSEFPIDNLEDEAISIPCRTTGETGSKKWVVTITGASVDTFGIAGHNFSSSGLFRIYRGDNSSPAVASMETVTMTRNHFIHYWSSLDAKDYVVFTASEDTGDGFHEVGVMWTGKRYELPFSPQTPIPIADEEIVGENFTSGGQRWSYLDYKRKGYEMSYIEDVTPAMYSSLEEMVKDRGTEKPFFFHLKPTDCGSVYAYDPVLFVHNTEFAFSIDGKDKRPGSWSVEEEK